MMLKHFFPASPRVKGFAKCLFHSLIHVSLYLIYFPPPTFYPFHAPTQPTPPTPPGILCDAPNVADSKNQCCKTKTS